MSENDGIDSDLSGLTGKRICFAWYHIMDGWMDITIKIFL